MQVPGHVKYWVVGLLMAAFAGAYFVWWQPAEEGRAAAERDGPSLQVPLFYAQHDDAEPLWIRHAETRGIRVEPAPERMNRSWVQPAWYERLLDTRSSRRHEAYRNRARELAYEAAPHLKRRAHELCQPCLHPQGQCAGSFACDRCQRPTPCAEARLVRSDRRIALTCAACSPAARPWAEQARVVAGFVAGQSSPSEGRPEATLDK